MILQTKDEEFYKKETMFFNRVANKFKYYNIMSYKNYKRVHVSHLNLVDDLALKEEYISIYNTHLRGLCYYVTKSKYRTFKILEPSKFELCKQLVDTDDMDNIIMAIHILKSIKLKKK